MGFVKTPEEVARIQDALTSVAFLGAEILSVDFLTDPGVVAHVLPPGLNPGRRPRVTAMVGRWRSTCVGDFAGGAIYVSARHGDVTGDYVLAMFMDSDAATIFGRDLYGEPKKIARTGLFRHGSRATGWVERRGVNLIDLEVDLDAPSEPADVMTSAFNVKAALAVDGHGLAADAVITQTEFRSVTRLYRPGQGNVVLRGTVHDPLDELPVREIIGARYLEGDRYATARAVGTIAAETFVPYAYGRLDDWSALGTADASTPIA